MTTNLNRFYRAIVNRNVVTKSVRTPSFYEEAGSDQNGFCYDFTKTTPSQRETFEVVHGDMGGVRISSKKGDDQYSVSLTLNGSNYWVFTFFEGFKDTLDGDLSDKYQSFVKMNLGRIKEGEEVQFEFSQRSLKGLDKLIHSLQLVSLGSK